MASDPRQTRTLVVIKAFHTVAWAFFVGCILAIPIAGALGRYAWAAIFSGIVLVECLILAANRCRCPLTNLAERFTDDQAENFDIYLPLWLARRNKVIFGTLFACAEAFVIVRWLLSGR